MRLDDGEVVIVVAFVVVVVRVDEPSKGEEEVEDSTANDETN